MVFYKAKHLVIDMKSSCYVYGMDPGCPCFAKVNKSSGQRKFFLFLYTFLILVKHGKLLFFLSSLLQEIYSCDNKN